MAYARNIPDRLDQTSEKSGGSQKDLFNLSGSDGTTPSGYHLKAVQSLALEGIRVTSAGRDHWILRGNRPLPEIHCYSEQELQRFARSNARHYLTNTDRET